MTEGKDAFSKIVKLLSHSAAALSNNRFAIVSYLLFLWIKDAAFICCDHVNPMVHGEKCSRNPVNGRMDNIRWRRAFVRLPLSIFIGLFSVVVPFLSSGQGMELLGAGATFPYPLYSKMFYVYWQATGIKTNYQAIGSGGGQRQLLNMTVDFGGSDAFMADEALEQAPAKILHIPICLGAVAITYNLPGKTGGRA
jgi:hypothetical protein